jgi:hypothetical protein
LFPAASSAASTPCDTPGPGLIPLSLDAFRALATKPATSGAIKVGFDLHTTTTVTAPRSIVDRTPPSPIESAGPAVLIGKGGEAVPFIAGRKRGGHVASKQWPADVLPIESPGVQHWLRADRRRGRAYLAIGLAILLMFAVVALTIDHPTAVLENPRVRTSAHVVDVDRAAGLIVVEYTSQGSTRSATLQVDDSPGYEPGQSTVVYVHTWDAEDVSLEPERDQPSSISMAAMGLLVPGLYLIGLAVVVFWDIEARRRLLSRPPAYDHAAWAAVQHEH